jgi:cell division septum initiation protein DivIVA
MSDLAKSRPEFTAAIRGYDRLQVDEYVERLHRLLAEAEERARAAEDDLEFSRHATVGPRVSQIFDLAVEESQELRQRVHREADAVLADARDAAERILDAAQDDEAEIRERTQEERQELLVEMDRQRDAARAQLHTLEERRTKLVGELTRLHHALGSAAGIVQDDVDSEMLDALDEDEDTAPTQELAVDEGDAAERVDPASSSDRASAAG